MDTVITPQENGLYDALILANTKINRAVDVRMSRTKNMDGTTTTIRSGYSAGDQTLTVQGQATEEQETALRYWAQNDILVGVYVHDGIETGWIKTIRGNNGAITLTIWLYSEFSVIEPEDGGGGGGGGG